jgi:hypothetical protein
VKDGAGTRRPPGAALLWLAGLLLLALLGYLVAETRVQHHDLDPVDGAFQTLNALRSVAAGERLGVDLVPYLGLGATAALYLPFAWLGGDLHASLVVTWGVSIGCFFVSLYLLGRWSGLAPPAAFLALVLLVAGTLALATGLGTAERQLRLLFFASNSLLSVRSFLPFLTGLLIWAIARARHGATNEIPHGPAATLLVGCLAGLQPLWANDYGIPSALALAATFLLYGVWNRPRALASTLTLLLAAPTTAVLGLWLITAGEPGHWLEYNFVSVAGDQFWFYPPWDQGERILSADDLLASLLAGPAYFPGYKLVALLAMALLVARRPRGAGNVGEMLLLYVTATSFGAGLLAELGGHRDERYFAGLLRATLYAGPWVAWTLSSWLAPGTAGGLVRAALSRPGRRTTLAAGVALLAGLTLLLALHNRERLAALNREYPTPAPELGVKVAAGAIPLLELGRALRRLAEASSLDPHRRGFPIYLSAFELVAGARHPGRHDSVIHALGRERGPYLDALLAGPYPYVTTLDPGHSVEYWDYSGWNLRSAWYLFRELLLHYEPVARAHQLLLWRPRAAAVAHLGDPVGCLAARGRRPGEWSLRLSDGRGDGQVYLVEVELDYATSRRRDWLPVAGSRVFLRVSETAAIPLPRVEGDSLRQHALPAGRPGWTFPVEHRSGSATQVRIEAFPADTAALEIRGCRAHLHAPAAALFGTEVATLEAEGAAALAERLLGASRTR